MCYDGAPGACSKHRRIHLQRSSSSSSSSVSSVSSVDWQEAQLKEAFDLMDRDGDGTIKASDLMHCAQYSLKGDFGNEEVESMIRLADRDGNGAVDFEEFLSLVQPRITPRAPPLGNEVLGEIFRVLDRNGDGVLSAEDLSGVMETLGQALSEEDILAMVQTATGSDRRDVTFQDFCLLMSSPGAQ